MTIKLKVRQDCTEEEMALISAAVRAYRETGSFEEGSKEHIWGWRLSALVQSHGLDFFVGHGLRNLNISNWRKVGHLRRG